MVAITPVQKHLSVSILKDKYYPVFELGYGRQMPAMRQPKSITRPRLPISSIGVDWNLLKNKHDDYRLFGGFHYGFTLL